MPALSVLQRGRTTMSGREWTMGGSDLVKRKSSAGFVARPTVYKLSVAPTGRARCRVCKGLVGKCELRLEACAFVMPGRRTMFVTHAACVTTAQARDILSVYGCVERVPSGGGASPERVEEARGWIKAKCMSE